MSQECVGSGSLRRHLFPIRHRVGEGLGSVEDEEGVPDESHSWDGVAHPQISLAADLAGAV